MGRGQPSRKDIVALLIAGLATPARFDKAVQHLREAGTLEQSPKDIGALIREVQADVKAECAELIRDKLFDYAWPTIARGIIKGLPEWYKQQLLHLQFAHTTPEEAA